MIFANGHYQQREHIYSCLRLMRQTINQYKQQYFMTTKDWGLLPDANQPPFVTCDSKCDGPWSPGSLELVQALNWIHHRSSRPFFSTKHQNSHQKINSRFQNTHMQPEELWKPLACFCPVLIYLKWFHSSVGGMQHRVHHYSAIYNGRSVHILQ